jgi:hypothetical protein
LQFFYDLAWSGKKAFNCLQQYPKEWAVFILKFQFLKKLINTQKFKKKFKFQNKIFKVFNAKVSSLGSRPNTIAVIR